MVVCVWRQIWLARCKYRQKIHCVWQCSERKADVVSSTTLGAVIPLLNPLISGKIYIIFIDYAGTFILRIVHFKKKSQILREQRSKLGIQNRLAHRTYRE